MLRVFEAFSGVGAQRMALRNLGIEHEVVGVSEIDIPAINSYAAIHENLLGNDDFNYPSKEEMIEYLASKNIGLDVKTEKVKIPKQIDKLQLIYKASVLSKCVGDISIINPHDLPDMDLFTYSFPCQDLSVAGQRAGMIKGQTRSGLLYECEKIIEAKRPKYLLLENVKNLVGKNFKSQFEEWLAYLESLGYTNYWQVLNAKDYGVPQNRERVFVVSILGDHSTYVFPTPIPLTRVIKDVLEDEVEERYYMNKPFKLVNKGHQAEFLNMAFDQGARIYSEDHVMRTLGAKERGQNNILIRAYVEGLNNQNGRVIDSDGICGTLDTMQGGHREPKILIEPVTKVDTYLSQVKTLIHEADEGAPVSGVDKSINQPQLIQVANCLTAREDRGISNHRQEGTAIAHNNPFMVRKLTPLECWRLMGFSDDDFNKAKSVGTSNSQLYKQAGNSIVVPVLEGILEPLINNAKER